MSMVPTFLNSLCAGRAMTLSAPFFFSHWCKGAGDNVDARRFVEKPPLADINYMNIFCFILVRCPVPLNASCSRLFCSN